MPQIRSFYDFWAFWPDEKFVFTREHCTGFMESEYMAERAVADTGRVCAESMERKAIPTKYGISEHFTSTT